MDGHATFNASCGVMLLLAAVTYVATSLVVAPYGRHVQPGWGPCMPARWGWVTMESPALWVTLTVFARGRYRFTFSNALILSFYVAHYCNRVVVYPFRARLRGKRMPVLVAALAFAFNCFNGYLQAYFIGNVREYSSSWFAQPQFLCGAVLFLAGMSVNIHADSLLMSLRSTNASGGDGRVSAPNVRPLQSLVRRGHGEDSQEKNDYKIPHGFLFERVSCPNYFGEIMEWAGWAVLTWSYPGFLFLLYTLANLVPRALAHHAWYRQKFEDYPERRRAVIPFLF